MLRLDDDAHQDNMSVRDSCRTHGGCAGYEQEMHTVARLDDARQDSRSVRGARQAQGRSTGRGRSSKYDVCEAFSPPSIARRAEAHNLRAG